MIIIIWKILPRNSPATYFPYKLLLIPSCKAEIRNPAKNAHSALFPLQTLQSLISGGPSQHTAVLEPSDLEAFRVQAALVIWKPFVQCFSTLVNKLLVCVQTEKMSLG